MTFVSAGENQQPPQSHEALRAERPAESLHSQNPLPVSGLRAERGPEVGAAGVLRGRGAVPALAAGGIRVLAVGRLHAVLDLRWV